MNKIIFGINLSDSGSTGIIMRNQLEYAHDHGDYDYRIIVPHCLGKTYSYGFADGVTIFEKLINRFLFFSHLKPDGFENYTLTKKIIKYIDKISANYETCLVHLHNIHMCNIDMRMLFKYLSKKDFKIFFTLHDQWIFTGGCYVSSYANCSEWEKGCYSQCPLKFGRRFYSVHKNLEIKKKYIDLVKEKITFINVSMYMNELFKRSIFKDYSSIVIHGECNFVSNSNAKVSKKMLGIKTKYVLISVSSMWTDFKGAKFLYEFATKMPSDFTLVIVGKNFPPIHKENVLIFEHIDNLVLNKYYKISDCFVSTTQDDNLPLVLMEAQINGVPVVGFGHGGTSEEITYKSGEMIGKNNDVDLLVRTVIDAVRTQKYKKRDVIASGMRFAKYSSCEKILNLYNQTLK